MIWTILGSNDFLDLQTSLRLNRPPPSAEEWSKGTCRETRMHARNTTLSAHRGYRGVAYTSLGFEASFEPGRVRGPTSSAISQPAPPLKRLHVVLKRGLSRRHASGHLDRWVPL